MPQYQEEEEQTPYPVQNPYMMPGQMSEGLLQYQIDANEIIDELEHILKGEAPVVDKKTASIDYVRRQGIKPLINEKGINVILTILRSHLTKIFILSDFDEEAIINMTADMGNVIIDDLYFNWEEYEIPTPSAASTIVRIITNTVYATLRKGYLGGYLKFLKTAQRITEVQSFNGRQQQPEMEQRRSLNPFAMMGKKQR